MHLNRGLLFWGLALVTAGATALAVQQGYIDRDVVADAWRLWPVILIAIGLSIVLARTPFAVLGTVLAALILGVGAGALVTVGPSVACTGSLPTDLQTRNGTFSGSPAGVTLDFNCGRLDVSLADGSGWQARTGVTGNREVRLSSSADSLTIRSPEGGFGVNEGKQHWQVELGSVPTYDLQINANAADARFDLSGARIDDFSMSMNAGSGKFQTDADTALGGSISMNAGRVEFCTAPGAAVRIRVDANITFSHNLDDRDLNRSGDTWTSDGFEGADQVIDLRVSGNAASFTLNPDGGCS